MGVDDGRTVKFAIGRRWQDSDIFCPECLRDGIQVNMMIDRMGVPTIYMCPSCRYVLELKRKETENETLPDNTRSTR